MLHSQANSIWVVKKTCKCAGNLRKTVSPASSTNPQVCLRATATLLVWRRSVLLWNVSRSALLGALKGTSVTVRPGILLVKESALHYPCTRHIIACFYCNLVVFPMFFPISCTAYLPRPLLDTCYKRLLWLAQVTRTSSVSLNTARECALSKNRLHYHCQLALKSTCDRSQSVIDAQLPSPAPFGRSALTRAAANCADETNQLGHRFTVARICERVHGHHSQTPPPQPANNAQAASVVVTVLIYVCVHSLELLQLAVAPCFAGEQLLAR